MSGLDIVVLAVELEGKLVLEMTSQVQDDLPPNSVPLRSVNYAIVRQDTWWL